MTAEWAQAWAGFAEAAVVLISVVYIAAQVRAAKTTVETEHDWRRRRATYDFFNEVMLGRFDGLRCSLPQVVDIYDTAQTYESVRGHMSDEHKRSLRSLLNILELLAIAEKNAVIDPEIAYDSFRSLVISMNRWGTTYIDEEQGQGKGFFENFTALAKKWTEKAQKESLRDGKMPTGRMGTV